MAVRAWIVLAWCRAGDQHGAGGRDLVLGGEHGARAACGFRQVVGDGGSGAIGCAPSGPKVERRCRRLSGAVCIDGRGSGKSAQVLAMRAKICAGVCGGKENKHDR
ncbi:hypothetical protein GCM10020220_059730 [Nonomuraea rubra]